MDYIFLDRFVSLKPTERMIHTELNSEELLHRTLFTWLFCKGKAKFNYDAAEHYADKLLKALPISRVSQDLPKGDSPVDVWGVARSNLVQTMYGCIRNAVNNNVKLWDVYRLKLILCFDATNPVLVRMGAAFPVDCQLFVSFSEPFQLFKDLYD